MGMTYYRTQSAPLGLVSQPRTLRFPDGSRAFRPTGGSFTLEQMLAAGYYLDIPPTYDAATHKLGETVTFAEDGTCEINVVPRTAEEIAADKQSHIDQIAQAGKAYLDAQIDPDGLILVDRLYRAGHPYGVANNDWGLAVRLEQYRRMALVDSGAEDFAEWMTDFSEFGSKPYTVPQMLAAAMGA